MALILPAYAKVNLTLDVLGRRPNGYHDIDSVMQTISLHDLISVERSDCRVFEVVGPAIEGENLVLKAARELEAIAGRALPFTIRLFKRIPLGAGLGGGSSDAAAFLQAANQLYDLRLTPRDLADVATQVGQDIPFFLLGGTARATGLGSTISPLPSVPSSWYFLVVCPPVQISTRTVYAAVDGNAPSAGRTPRLIETLGTPSPALPAGGREKDGGGDIFGNDMETVSRRLFPEFNEVVDKLRSVVPSLTMSGTGAAMFAVFDDRPQAKAALAAIKPLGYPAWLCRPVAAK